VTVPPVPPVPPVLRPPRLRAGAAAVLLLGIVTGCAQSGSGGTAQPNTAGSASAVPGEAPKPGQGAGGGIRVTDTSIVRAGSKLTVTATIHNDETTADDLVQVGSEVTASTVVTPPLTIPAGGSVTLGGAHKVVLDQNARLEPGGTVALQFQFTKAGSVQVFSSFLDTP
jgi:copper(I)-binding protein